MNSLTAAGRVTADAELRSTTSGQNVLGFTVANDVGFGERKTTNWIRCSLWGKRAESLHPYLKKGTPITVTGEARLRKWESDGKSGTELELNVRDLALQGAKDSPPAAKDVPPEDDIPFSQEAA